MPKYIAKLSKDTDTMARVILYHADTDEFARGYGATSTDQAIDYAFSIAMDEVKLAQQALSRAKADLARAEDKRWAIAKLKSGQ